MTIPQYENIERFLPGPEKYYIRELLSTDSDVRKFEIIRTDVSHVEDLFPGGHNMAFGIGERHVKNSGRGEISKQKRNGGLDEYERVVRLLTEATKRDPLFKKLVERVELLDEKDPRTNRATYHTDHKLSIREAYDLGIPEEIVASIPNLEVMRGPANSSKGRKSSITEETLRKNYKNHRELYG